MRPDLQKLYVSSAKGTRGQAYRDDGEGALSLGFNQIPVLTNPTQVAASGIPVGGLYVLALNHQAASGTLNRRLA